MNKKEIDLKKIRENQRLTQSEFGKILGVSRSTITKIEGGEVKLSKKMIQKLENSFPKDLGLPYDSSNWIGNENESDILTTIISTNIGQIEQVKEVIKAMCTDTEFVYEEDRFLNKFLISSKKSNFEQNRFYFENNSAKYEYKFLLDFLNITKDCLFSIYEDLFTFSSVKYLYRKDKK